MVRLIGPCLSGQASGKFGSILIFKRRFNTNMVTRYFKPKNPKTAGQTTSRARIASAVARWKSALQSTRDAWDLYGSPLNRTGYNLYLSNFVIWMRDHAEAEPGAPFLPS